MNPTQLDQPYRLSQAVMDRVDKEAAKYPSRRAAVKSALRYCQEETGWVSNGVVTAVATHLGLEPIEVYEVATFYDMFYTCLLYTSPSPRDRSLSRMPSSA